MQKSFSRRAIVFLAVIVVIAGAQVYTTHAYTGAGIEGKGQAIPLFDGAACLLLQPGWEYLDEEAYAEYYDSDVVFDPTYRYGILMIEEEDVFVNADLHYDKIGRIDDSDVQALDAGAILEYYRFFYGNPEEGAEDTISEFYLPLAYDEQKHKLSWCMQLTDMEGNPYFLYETIILTKDGYVEFYATCERAETAEMLHVVMEEDFAITAGNEYGDFNPAVDEESDWGIADIVPSYYGGEEHAYDGEGGLRTGFVSVLIGVLVVVGTTIRIAVARGKVKQRPTGRRKQAFRQEPAARGEKTAYHSDNYSYYLKMREEEEKNAWKEW